MARHQPGRELLECLKDFIWVEPCIVEQVGSIYLAETTQDRVTYGKVLAVGPLVPFDIQLGDTVLYNLYDAMRFKVDGAKDEWTALTAPCCRGILHR